MRMPKTSPTPFTPEAKKNPSPGEAKAKKGWPPRGILISYLRVRAGISTHIRERLGASP
jgi:hypothetical protein